MSAGYTITTTAAAVVLASGVAKSVVGVVMGTNAPLRIVEVGISFDGIGAAAVPATVNLISSAVTGTGTNAPPVQIRGQLRTVQATGAINYAVEPTPVVILKSWFVPVFNGTFAVQFPLGREMDTITTTRPGLFLQVTAPAGVNARGYFEIEEGG